MTAPSGDPDGTTASAGWDTRRAAGSLRNSTTASAKEDERPGP
ncbi:MULTISPECIES: hypothetical protein [Brevibacterium]